jgi:DNA-binding NarL/FixJ family response regulator
MSEPVIRVLIVDDQLLMRDGLASLLNIQPGIDVVGTAENGQEAIAIVADLLPDIVLMDVRMPVMDGIEATAEIHRQFPEIKVLMLTTFDDEAYVTGALRAGAFGYVLKTRPREIWHRRFRWRTGAWCNWHHQRPTKSPR